MCGLRIGGAVSGVKRAGVKQDPSAKTKYTLYSLRHTAICMRLVLTGNIAAGLRSTGWDL